MAEVDRPQDQVAVRLGEGLRAGRTAAGINQRELARLLDVPANYISRWETGVRRLELETIERAEKVMGLQPGTVFRLAGYVDDGGLVDVDTLPPWARRSVRALLRQVAQDRSTEAVAGDDGDGFEGAP